MQHSSCASLKLISMKLMLACDVEINSVNAQDDILIVLLINSWCRWKFGVVAITRVTVIN